MFVFQDLMLQQTWGSLQQLKTLVNDKGHKKLKFELSWRDEVRHKYDFLNQVINAISQVWKKPVLSNLKALSLIDTSIFLTNFSTQNCICWISFWNGEYTILYTIHPSGVICKGVLQSQIRNSLSARKWIIISKI